MGALPETGDFVLTIPVDYPDMSPEAQHQAIEKLSAILEDNRSQLVDTWGGHRYDQVTEMVEVEAVSIDIREQR